MPINRWIVPSYCSRWLIFTRASHLDFCLLSSRRYKCNSILFMFINDDIIKIYKWCHMIIHVISHVSYAPTSINIHYDDEGTSFITFVRRSLYPKGNNVSKDEGLWPLMFCDALFLTHSIWWQVPNIGAHLLWTHSTTIGMLWPLSCRRRKLRQD
jgi:hypothetical protein